MSDPFESNPFSSRFIRPGAIPYRFQAGARIETVLNRLRDCNGQGAIVGPHGSGKSTLLCTLVPELSRRGWQTTVLTLHDRERWLPHGWMPSGTQQFIVVDGFEQLNFISRWWLRATCRARRWGLLVTAHGPMGLPVVHRTETSPELLASLVREITPDTGRRLSKDALTGAYSRSQGNLREAFFGLYDLYELPAYVEPRSSAARTIDTAGSILPVI
jgi:hypothetical protein